MLLKDLKIEKHRVRAKALNPNSSLKEGVHTLYGRVLLVFLKVNKYFYEVKMESTD